MHHKVSQYFTVLELYSAFGPVFSSTVGPPVSRLSKWTVNQAVNPWKTPDFSTQKWNWAFISWEIKQKFHHLSSQKFILFVLEQFLINQHTHYLQVFNLQSVHIKAHDIAGSAEAVIRLNKVAELGLGEELLLC